MDTKNTYNPLIHHRRSIRLKGYDYSQAGAYFITICVKERHCLFGKIAEEKMILNDAGIMVNKWWEKIPEKFPDIELDVYQVMPNHFHAIVINTGKNITNANEEKPKKENNIIDNSIAGEHHNSPLYDIVRWFKTMCTNEYIRNVKSSNWHPFPGKLFQRNYWEHIIRDEKSYNNIASYIQNNPGNWNNDLFFAKS